MLLPTLPLSSLAHLQMLLIRTFLFRPDEIKADYWDMKGESLADALVDDMIVC